MLLIRATAWLSCALYLLAIIAGWRNAQRVARSAWIAGCAAFLCHLAAAFSFRHGWSHQAALEDTARQTAQLFGLHWGGGIYLNYLFTAVWTVDAIWMGLYPSAYHSRPRLLSAAIHVFMAFMFLNGALVFPIARWWSGY